MKVRLGLVVVGVVWGVAAPAVAAGGTDIASAPVVVIGQVQMGDTASDSTAGSGGSCSVDNAGLGRSSWWNLPVIAGDVVTIDWEPIGENHALRVLPVGTTDFTVKKTKPEAESKHSTPSKARLRVKAGFTGTMPIVVYDGGCSSRDPGPFYFTTYVKHRVLLSVPRVSVLPRHGSLSVGVRNGDGAPITDSGVFVRLEYRYDGKTGVRYGIIGRAVGANNGTAQVAYVVPRSLRGKRVYLRASATGPNYSERPSTSRLTRVVR